ncbi:hypothetical protein [Aestuariivita boseongensis]|nr:hypothetical protein [Aestuariivita boseongensis]
MLLLIASLVVLALSVHGISASDPAYGSQLAILPPTLSGADI